MVDRILDYPQTARDLSSLFKQPYSRELEEKAMKILEKMNPKELAIYMADNPECERGLLLADNYIRKQDAKYKEGFQKYLRYPDLLDFSDEVEETLIPL